MLNDDIPPLKIERLDDGTGQGVSLLEQEDGGTPLRQTCEPTMSTIQANPARVERYRQRHCRIDYYPADDVVNLIAYYKAIGTEKRVAIVIDTLIRAGHKVVSGNAAGHSATSKRAR